MVKPTLQVFDQHSDILYTKHKKDDALNKISDRDCISSTLPSKRNADRDVLLKGNERIIVAEKE